MVQGLEPLKIFDFTLVGFTMIVLGFIYLMLFGNRLLPDRKHAIEALENQNREYIAEVRIANSNDYEGKTAEESGLLAMKGLYLIEIIRGGRSIQPVTSTTLLQKEDILLFCRRKGNYYRNGGFAQRSATCTAGHVCQKKPSPM